MFFRGVVGLKWVPEITVSENQLNSLWFVSINNLNFENLADEEHIEEWELRREDNYV